MIQNYIVEEITMKKTKLGKPFISSILTDENEQQHSNVAIWSNFPGFAAIKVGGKVMGEIEDVGKGASLKATGSMAHVAGGITEAQNRKHEHIDQSMTQKETSIKLSSIMRDSVLIVTNLYPDIIKDLPEDQRDAKVKEALDMWRRELAENWDTFKNMLSGEIPF